jgi:glycosyltransferase involved in cell wall biosynthesis
MKILWLCNIPLPRISITLSKPVYNIGGWLSGLSDCLIGNDEIQLFICFPDSEENKLLEGDVDGIQYFGFPTKGINLAEYPLKLESIFREIINKVKPDVLHIFGTENSYSLAMINVFNNPKKTVINIQGLVSVYSKHYLAGLPCKIIHRYTLRDIIRGSNIISGKKRFEKSGVLEIEAIRKVKNIIGRTDWDKACTTQINPKINYFFCNESLRQEFYEYKWNIKKCEKYSIFLSQAMYPIKGLHYVIEAMPLIIKSYPNVHLYIAGSTIRIEKNSLKDKLLMSSYAKHVHDLIIKYKLNEYITFTGSLDEISMCDRYLKSHVFVCPSSIENSPNSLGEAMLLGVPSVAADIGGVTSMAQHKEESFIYQHDAPYMLAYYVNQIFSNDKLANTLSEKSRAKAKKTHNREINKNRLIEIYRHIVDGN